MDPFLEEQGESGGGGFDPMSMLRAVCRRNLLSISPFVLCLTIAFIPIRTLTPIYACSVQIFINHNSWGSRLMNDHRDP